MSDIPRIRDPRSGVTFPAHLAKTAREKRLVQNYLTGLPTAQRREVTYAIERAMGRPVAVTVSLAVPVYAPWTDSIASPGPRPTTKDMAGHLVMQPEGPEPVPADRDVG